MKFKILTTLLIFSFIALSLTSCKKDEEEEDSFNLLLTNRSQKTWILRSVMQKDKEILNDEWKEILLDDQTRAYRGWTEKLKSCQKDNEWIFSDDGSIKKTPGYIRCSLNESDSTLSYFLGGPKNQSLYFKELVSEQVWYPSLHRDSTFTFYKIQKTDILVLTANELKYKYIFYSPYGHYVTTSIYSLIRK